MRKALAALAAVLLVTAALPAAVGAAGAPPTPPHRFFGHVTDADGSAVAGATVEVTYENRTLATATTNASGYYDLTVSDPNASTTDEVVTLSVRAASTSHQWRDGGSTELDLRLPPEESAGGGGGGGLAPVSDTTTTTTTTSTTTEPTTTSTTTSTTTPTTTTSTTIGTTSEPTTTSTTTTTSAAAQEITRSPGMTGLLPWLAALLWVVLVVAVYAYRRHTRDEDDTERL